MHTSGLVSRSQIRRIVIQKAEKKEKCPKGDGVFGVSNYAQVLKANPYHDTQGMFTSKDHVRAVASARAAKIREARTGAVSHQDTAAGQAAREQIGNKVPVQQSSSTIEELKLPESEKPLGGPFRSKIVPTKENAEHRQKLTTYMEGYYKNLKNESEKKYVAERVRQMMSGESRPSGMSGKFGLTKQRAIQYEALTYKIFQTGRKKVGL